MNIQHSSKSDEWYTPLDIIIKVKQVLGDVDLDPASDDFGNARVGATYYINKETNGLLSPWPTDCSIFCNPPGGKTKNQSNTALFWKKLMKYKEDGNLKHAIFLCFSIESAQNTQDKDCPSILEFPFCIPKRRIKFDNKLTKKIAPSHSNVILYVPGSVDNTDKFKEVFLDVGLVRV